VTFRPAANKNEVASFVLSQKSEVAAKRKVSQ